tara:strand:+ start:429 stop:1859 length:1431 start_codon:yes stop_codon:yes gene_type:complete
MANIIEQDPLYDLMPVGQPIIFTISNAPIVTTYFNVKFIGEVYISHITPPNMSVTTDLVGTFKTTPNNEGVGIFDFSTVVENHVKSDNLSGVSSAYKTAVVTATSSKIPLHLIDKWSTNTNSLAWMTIKFQIEGSLTSTGIPAILPDQATPTGRIYEIFNGYLKYTDRLIASTIDDSFGYVIAPFLPSDSSKRFLTNAPTTQYANVEDYGTIGIFNSDAQIEYIKFSYYNSSGVLISNEDVLPYISSSIISQSKYRLLYLGCFPANLQNWSTTFAAALLVDLSYYTIVAYNSSDVQITQDYTINVNCFNINIEGEKTTVSTAKIKGYNPIRLAWLNQWGAWDYYTFTKKSSRSISTQGSTYTQLEGTWNESTFKLNGYRGGKKAFRVNATEKVTMNTDFVTEADSEWFEELINSPEVYILEGFQDDPNGTMETLNIYVTPVRLTTSSYTRKTVANDKLMQYTIEVEKSKTLRTQAI